ncbi:conserved protein [Tepidicaulis marinus]|uniref:Conserved protein n=1 Tax=Tepidicaulis marinus TaxID=1333998 RepID=A0A081BES6_9HYPH|nr:DUF6324 family protein [Tepidicaulis marinus]GAK46544.1 conserved protein [Tepidicaulis marinus]
MSKNNGINRETAMEGEIQIGPTSLGMVRLYVRGENFDLPMDFTPDEAREIAEEIVSAAEEAQGMAAKGKNKGGKAPRR